MGRIAVAAKKIDRLRLIVLCLGMASLAFALPSRAAVSPVQQIDNLIKLQKKEITYSQTKLEQAKKKLASAEATKTDLAERVLSAKDSVRRGMMQLEKLTRWSWMEQAWNAGWLSQIDALLAKGKILSGKTEKQLVLVATLKKRRGCARRPRSTN